METTLIEELIDLALTARQKAYAPYSHFAVGAVVVAQETGEKYLGANIENASYGLTVCAERNAIFQAVLGGMKKIQYLCVVADTPTPVSPCGACRQVMSEFATQETQIILANLKREYKVFSMEELLPYGFVFEK